MSLTALSSSTVGIGGQTPADVQIWDWKQGKLLRTLAGFDNPGCLTHIALFSDMRLVATDWAGKIHMRKLSDLRTSAIVHHTGASRLAGLVVTRDGTLVTASQSNGEIKLWRDGLCTATFSGGYSRPDDNSLHGNSLAAIGGRLLAAGKDNTVLVFE